MAARRCLGRPRYRSPGSASEPGAARDTVLAVGAVVSIVWGWGVAQYPDILPGSLSLADAAAPPGSQAALLIVFIVAALVIAPSLGLLYYLDQQSRLLGHAVSPDVAPGDTVES